MWPEKALLIRSQLRLIYCMFTLSFKEDNEVLKY